MNPDAIENQQPTKGAMARLSAEDLGAQSDLLKLQVPMVMRAM
jgi:hypothetical protein